MIRGPPHVAQLVAPVQCWLANTHLLRNHLNWFVTAKTRSILHFSWLGQGKTKKQQFVQYFHMKMKKRKERKEMAWYIFFFFFLKVICFISVHIYHLPFLWPQWEKQKMVRKLGRFSSLLSMESYRRASAFLSPPIIQYILIANGYADCWGSKCFEGSLLSGIYNLWCLESYLVFQNPEVTLVWFLLLLFSISSVANCYIQKTNQFFCLDFVTSFVLENSNVYFFLFK
jgi:hypothetical protein